MMTSRKFMIPNADGK